VDVINTVAKPISTTQHQWSIAWETIINTTGSIFNHQAYLYIRHVHHRRIVHINCDTEVQWNLNHKQLQTVHRLLRGHALRDHPEKFFVDYTRRTYVASIDQFINKQILSHHQEVNTFIEKAIIALPDTHQNLIL
jgi:hypothetical protein